MSRLQEYNPEFGVVFETEAEKWARENGITIGGGTGGTKPSGPTTTTTNTYAQSQLQDKQGTLAGQPGIYTREQLAAMPGAKMLGNNTIITGSGDKYSLRSDGTGLWAAFGAANAADRKAYDTAGVPIGSGGVTAQPGTVAQPGVAAQPASFTSLQPQNGMQIPGFGAYQQTISGGIPSEGRQTLSTRDFQGTGLNTLYPSTDNNIQYAPGRRDIGQTGNPNVFNPMSSSIAFNQNNRGVEPQMLFPDAQVSVPGSYVKGEGNVNDSNRAFSVPFNIGPSGAAMMNIAGNNVQLQSADKGTGYGYVLNAAPSSNVGLTTGRALSEDPAIQAAQALMLHSAIQQGGGGAGAVGALQQANSNQYSGYGAGATGFFGGNGGQGQGQYWQGYSASPATAPATTPSSPSLPPGSYGPAYGNNDQIASHLGSNYASSAPVSGGIVGNSIAATLPSSGRSAAGSYGPAFANDAQAQSNVASMIAAAQAAMAQAQKDKDEKDKAAGGGDYSVENRFAGGGQVITRPLGSGPTAPKQMITPEQMYLVGKSGKVYGTMGEDNKDPGTVPNKELLTLYGPGNNTLDIKPLQPFANGGQAQYQPQPMSPAQQAMQEEAAAKEYWRTHRGMADSLPLFRQQQTFLPTYLQNGGMITPQANVLPVPFADGGMVNIDNGGIDAPHPFDPLSSDIIKPWEQAQQTLERQAHLRSTVDDPRRRAAGLGSSTGLSVLQGGIPDNNVGPGMFYDLKPQVDNAISQITGTQNAIRALGPEVDTSPLYGQTSDIGINLRTNDRLRDLAISRVAAAATDEAAKVQARSKLAGMQAELIAAQNAYNNAYQYSATQGGDDPQAALQHVYDLQAKITGLQSDIDSTNAQLQGSGPNLMAIDAEIAALQNSLPPGWTEAEARTRLAQLQTQISNADTRTQKGVEIKNLASLGVPNLTAPLAR